MRCSRTRAGRSRSGWPLAPATGLAALIVAGISWERLGVRMGGAGGVITMIVVTVVGAIAAVTERASE